jgi:hypothetical protein
MSDDQVIRFKVEAFRANEWQEILGLHRVSKGERFRVYALDGVRIAIQGTATKDGFLQSNGLGSVEFEYGAHDGDCNEPARELIYDDEGRLHEVR